MFAIGAEAISRQHKVVFARSKSAASAIPLLRIIVKLIFNFNTNTICMNQNQITFQEICEMYRLQISNLGRSKEGFGYHSGHEKVV